jgi:hypothetical protein
MLSISSSALSSLLPLGQALSNNVLTMRFHSAIGRLHQIAHAPSNLAQAKPATILDPVAPPQSMAATAIPSL